jgi:hypothetical protein
MTNTAAAAEGVDVAFVLVRGEHDHEPELHAEVKLDGAPLPYRALTDGEMLLPALRAWLTAHPEVERALRAVVERGDAVGGDASLRPIVAAAGGRCDEDCRHLLIWYRSTTAEGEQEPTSKRGEIDRAYEAAREAIPREVEALSRRWSKSAQPLRTGFLLFHLDFAPGQSRAVTVRYEQRATEDRSARVNTTYRFVYLLSPARRWASFGPLDISVRAPPRVDLTASLPLRRDGDAYHASLPTLPDGELTISTMSRDGLWFGWSDPAGYWALVLAAMGLGALGIGAATGKWWQDRRGRAWQGALLRIFVAGPLAAAVSFAALVLLASAFPPHALGYGYGAFFGGALLVLLSLPAGAAASFIAAAIHARRGR